MDESRTQPSSPHVQVQRQNQHPARKGFVQVEAAGDAAAIAKPSCNGLPSLATASNKAAHRSVTASLLSSWQINPSRYACSPLPLFKMNSPLSCLNAPANITGLSWLRSCNLALARLPVLPRLNKPRIKRGFSMGGINISKPMNSEEH
jgi:hypothetical protein